MVNRKELIYDVKFCKELLCELMATAENIDAILKTIEINANNIEEWTPLKKETPKIKGNYLVTLEDDKQAIILYWDGEKWLDEDININTVIAWRKLPEAYKEE